MVQGLERMARYRELIGNGGTIDVEVMLHQEWVECSMRWRMLTRQGGAYSCSSVSRIVNDWRCTKRNVPGLSYVGQLHSSYLSC